MRGIPLSPEAVEKAQQVDQSMKRSLIEIDGAVEAQNAKRLLEIGTSKTPGLLASPIPVLMAADGLISLGSYNAALEILENASKHFPQSLRRKQLLGLTLRRLGRYQDAIDVLSQLKVEGHQDPETIGILAAAWDGLYQQSGTKLHLRGSRELYRTAFHATNSKDYYTGINAAAKSLFLGEEEEAQRLANKVLPLVENAKDGRDFWASCTLGEVFLLQRNVEAATTQYQKVIDKHFSKLGDLNGTRQQAQRICEAYHLSATDIQKVMSPFKLLDE